MSKFLSVPGKGIASDPADRDALHYGQNSQAAQQGRTYTPERVDPKKRTGAAAGVLAAGGLPKLG